MEWTAGNNKTAVPFFIFEQGKITHSQAASFSREN
jgi:hypothetical protein